MTKDVNKLNNKMLTKNHGSKFRKDNQSDSVRNIIHEQDSWECRLVGSASLIWDSSFTAMLFCGFPCQSLTWNKTLLCHRQAEACFSGGICWQASAEMEGLPSMSVCVRQSLRTAQENVCSVLRLQRSALVLSLFGMNFLASSNLSC